ncbi:MAG TPA: hypothetical protein VK886_20650 [Vicinamibacterales bacterium]|nr:hypothetical protein [Vicinamibacterales bacterium]
MAACLHPSRRLAPGLLVAALLAASPLARQQPGGPPGPISEPEPLKFRYMGPPSAGRFSAAAAIPGETSTYYAGAASGGIWKSTDSGKTWAPIFDDQSAAAIGALAIDPSDPRTIWAGTGEAWVIRPTDVMGDGMYKSTDAGATWKHVGLAETGRIGRIVVHPTNPQIVYACALGRATGPQQDRGVFKTTDGGASWQRMLFVDPDTGCSGLSMDPKDPNVLVAGTWQVVMHTWAMFSGGPGSGIFMTRDGGTNWTRLSHPGLPKPPVGKVDVQIAPTNSNRIYALIQTPNQGSLWRSDDAGASWKVVSWDRRLIGRAGYYIRLGVSTKDENEVLVANSSLHRSTDGGATFTPTGGCGDCHDVWIDPKNADHYVVTGDATMGITTDHGKTFNNVALPIGQMYHVAVDNRAPYWIYSNRQDDGTMRGASTSPVIVANVPSFGLLPPQGRGGFFGGFNVPGRIVPGAIPWDQGIGGCESGFTIPDPEEPDIVWASCYGNKLSRYDHRTRTARSVAPWMISLDSPPTDAKYRCHWTAPIAVDPFDHDTVYYGCQVVFRTENAGQSWSVISPDLSTQDPSKIVPSGGVIGDNLGQFYGEVVYAIAPSPAQKGLIWAGTNDGKIWYTRDGGAKWVDVTANVTGMPAWGTITQISPSSFDPGTAYIAVDYHIMDNRDPYIYKTADFGQTWRKISDGLPKGHALSYVLSVAENPNRRGMLFAGTGNAFHYSLDDGGTWTKFREGLPPAPVTWIVVQKQHHDVVVSTYGRGLFILPDITRLEQSDRIDLTAPAALYEPRPGWRFARNGRADFLFNLKAAGPVQVDLLDHAGNVIRSLAADGRAGLNRATWDLRHEPARQVALRTTPPDNPLVWDEPRFRNQTTRPIVHWGIQQPQRSGPIAIPGTYTVRLTVNGQAQSKRFDVLKDPLVRASDEDLAASTAMQMRIRDDLNETADMANRIEVMRRQIEDQLKAPRLARDVDRALRALDKRMLDVELQLLSRSDLHSDDKWFVEAYKIYLNLLWLSGAVGTGAGDEAGGADHRPTDAQVAVLAEIEKALDTARADYRTLLEKDVPAFNRSMAGKVPPIGVSGTQ